MTNTTLKYQELWDEGQKLIEKHSSHIWTDYNSHDPGITQLDHLCYALADLGYRIDHPIADLLANPALAGQANTSFPAEQILTCRPLTLSDWRMLLIDLEQVRNAWLEPIALDHPIIYVDCHKGILSLDLPQKQKERRIRPQGGYRVLLELEDRVSDAVPVLAEVEKILQANRNLCEDFLEVQLAEMQYVGLCAELEVTPDADLARVHAALIYAVESFISPRPLFFTLTEMQQRGYVTEEIFQGPLLNNGFMDPKQLATTERPSELHLSDLVQVIMDIPDVVAVRSLAASSYEDGQAKITGAPWVLKLNPDRATRFAIEIGPQNNPKTITRILYYKNAVPFVPLADQVAEHLLALRAGDLHNKIPDNSGMPKADPGEWSDPGNYQTIQNDFPLNYGIGQHGLPPSATDQRKAQALQLKAWLLLFEQFMANYLAQLANFQQLFSLEEIEQTLFSQSPDDIPALHSLLNDTIQDYRSQLNQIAETPGQFQQRRNRFLDHLLARFGERFTEYVIIAARVYGQRAGRQILRDKTRYLKRYPELSAHRFAGFNISDPIGFGARSGLEHKLNSLMGELLDHFDFCLTPAGKTKFRMWSDDGLLLLTSFKGYADQEQAREAITPLLQIMALDEAYVRDKTQNKWTFYLEDQGTQLTLKEYFDSEQAREEAILLLQRFQADYPAGDRILVLEHFLLRPRGPGYSLLPACIRPQETLCYCDDPYSFRVHIVLPFWLPRFRNMNFRRFMERSIRELLPAHIMPTICWLKREDLDEVQELNRLWRNALKDLDPDLVTHQNNLIARMATLHSVFPEAELHDCIDGGDENPIVLDNTILGTFEPNEN